MDKQTMKKLKHERCQCLFQMVNNGVISLLIFATFIRCSLHIWNKKNARIMVKVRNKNEDDNLNIGHIDNHLKLAKTCHWNVNFPNICNMDDDIINLKKM